MPRPFYSLVHLSDLHFAFDLASPFDERLARGDIAAVNLDRFFRNRDIASLADAAALAASANLVEPILSSAPAPIRSCVVSGDICTWPYPLTLVNDAYRYFSGQFDYDGAGLPIGFSPAVTDQFLFLLGNHDTNGVVDNYRLSPFHQRHHAADRTRVFVVPTPQRWIVFFLVRTDFFLTLGWLGPSLLGLRTPAFLERFRRAVAAMHANHGPLTAAHCTGDTYDRAVKILVLHHSPLSWRDYPLRPEIRGIRGLWEALSRWRDYEVTRLMKREEVLRFVQDMRIHMVLFGHTHEALQQLRGQTLYVDLGTTAAATRKQLEAVAHDPQAMLRYDLTAFEFSDDDSLAVQTYTMTSHSHGFEPSRRDQYHVSNAGLV